jgi:hypothetical protein
MLTHQLAKLGADDRDRLVLVFFAEGFEFGAARFDFAELPHPLPCPVA